ncbi:MAG: hypothetical protein K1X94_10925 [Sandaracinaceae bacterium]|nr:hypothetical protein [Sandaracinaceae bacterium]
MLVDRDVPDLEGARWPAYAMWLDSTLAYVNPAYHRGMPPGWGLGARVLDAAGVLRAQLEAVHDEACATGHAVALRYACPTEQSEREFELRVYPLGPKGAPEGLLAIHSLVVEHAHESPQEAHEARYRDLGGMIRHCAHCRRTRRAGAAEVWDLVPAYLRAVPHGTSHGVCPPCAAHYFGGDLGDEPE